MEHQNYLNNYFEIDLGTIYSEEANSIDTHDNRKDEILTLLSIIKMILTKRDLITFRYHPDHARYASTKWDMWTNSKPLKGKVTPRYDYFMVESKNPNYTYESLSKMGINPLINYDLIRYDQECIINRDDVDVIKDDFDLAFAFRLSQLRHTEVFDFLEYHCDSLSVSDFGQYLKQICRDFENLLQDKKDTVFDWIESLSTSIKKGKTQISTNQCVLLFYFLLKERGLWWKDNGTKQKDFVELVSQVHGSNIQNVKQKAGDILKENKKFEEDLLKIRSLLMPLNYPKLIALIDRELM